MTLFKIICESDQLSSRSDYYNAFLNGRQLIHQLIISKQNLGVESFIRQAISVKPAVFKKWRDWLQAGLASGTRSCAVSHRGPPRLRRTSHLVYCSDVTVLKFWNSGTRGKRFHFASVPANSETSPGSRIPSIAIVSNLCPSWGCGSLG